MFGLHMGRMGGSGFYGNSAPAWTPAANFPLGTEPGLWIDYTNFASMYQDSAGTSLVTAQGQPNGKVLDKSGRGYHLSQPTASARPLTTLSGGVQSVTFDGLDDGMSTGAIVLGADMDCFIAIKRNSAQQCILLTPGAGSWAGYAQAGTSGGMFQNAGTPTALVDGSTFAGATPDAFNTALTVGPWHVVEFRNMNLTTWGGFGLSAYAGYALNGDIAGVILCPAGDAATRTKNRQFLGKKVGLTLP